MFKRSLLLLAGCLLAATASAQTTPIDAWINELHYDNDGQDAGEYVEVVVNSNFAAADYTVTLYNGNDGEVYASETLDTCTSTTTGSGWTIYGCLMEGIQNGPDGAALDHSGTLVQFLSYEGTFTAADGPAAGVTSTDIGIDESGNTALDQSLQLQGIGNRYGDFAWHGPAARTYHSVNTAQTLNVPSSDTRVVFESEVIGVDEGDAGVTQQSVGIVVSNPAAGAATEVVVEVSGTATEGTDYALNYPLGSNNRFTVTLAAGATAPQQPILVEISGDAADEGDETIVFEIASASGGVNAEIGSPASSTVTIENDDAPLPLLVINEFLADPPEDDSLTTEVEGDANGDGERNWDDDEFVEIVNTGASPIDMGGYTLSDGSQVRHTFPEGTVLQPGLAVVVFGGGEPDASLLNGIIQTTGSLGLANNGDVITLRAGDGSVVDLVEYGGDTGLDGGARQALARDPDFTGNFVSHTAISSNPVAYSPGDANSDGSPLPVELAAFTATAVGEGRVRLQWRTLSETNNAGFEVQRLRGGAFVDEAFVAGAGTTTEERVYEHLVTGLPAGAHTFRLRQVDFDGTTNLSPRVEVTVAVARVYVVDAPVPNPTTGRAVLGIAVQRAQEVRVELFDLLGRRVATPFAGRVGSNERTSVSVEGAALPSGLYVYRVTGETFSTTGQLMVMH